MYLADRSLRLPRYRNYPNCIRQLQPWTLHLIPLATQPFPLKPY
jgi:hypothetical protein